MEAVFLSGQAGPALHRPGLAGLSGGFQMRAGPGLQAFPAGLATFLRGLSLNRISMIPPVQQWTSPDRVRPSPVQFSPRNFWTGLGPIPNFSGPGLNWPGLLWTSLFGPNRPEYAGSY